MGQQYLSKYVRKSWAGIPGGGFSPEAPLADLHVNRRLLRNYELLYV